LKYA